MNNFIFITPFLSVNQKIPLILLPFTLLKCRPLMPKNPLKRLKVLWGYLFLYKYKNTKMVSLPVDGDIAMIVNDTNYKIINIKQKAIYTLFNKKNEELVYEKYKMSQFSIMYEEIHNIDKENRMIKGVFYNGYHPVLIHPNKNLNQKLSKLFINLILNSTIKYIKANEYVDLLVKDSEEVLTRNSSLISENQINLIKSFLIKNSEKFKSTYPAETIPLILSHGDIKQGNIIETQEGFQLIDWEFCEFRSICYDLYKFLWRYPNYIGNDFDKIFERIQAGLANESFHMQKFFEMLVVKHKELYFLEDLRLRLYQLEHRGFGKNFSYKINEYIKKSEEEINRV